MTDWMEGTASEIDNTIILEISSPRSQMKAEPFYVPETPPSDIVVLQDDYNAGGFVSEEEFEDVNNNRYINNTSCEENLVYESDFGTRKNNDDEYYLIKPDIR